MTDHTPDTSSVTRRERRLLYAVIALGLLLRLLRIGHQSLWVDELFTLEVATPKPGYPLWQLLRHNVHGPLHTFVVFLFRSVSENDGWLRVPSAIAGAVSIPLLHAWLRPRLGAAAALWGALLLAVNPLHVHYSQELRNYAFVVCFVLAACVQVDRLVARWTWRRCLGLALLVACALLSNFSATFAFLAMTPAYLMGAGPSRASFRRWAMVTLVTAALISPWIYRIHTYVDFSRLATPVLPGELDSGERLRGTTTFRVEAIPYAAYAYSAGLSLGPSLRELHGDAALTGVVRRHAPTVALVALAFGVAFLAGARALRRRGGWRLVCEVAGYILIPLAATMVLNWQNAKAFNVRYVIVGLPAFVAFLAAGVASLRAWRGWVAGAMLALSAVSLGNHYFASAFAKEDVKRAVAAVESRMDAGDCIFAPTVWEVVLHYLDRDAPVHYVYGDAPEATQRRQLDALFVECPSFWYVRARPWVDDPDGRVLSEVQRRCDALESLHFPGVDLTRYRVKQP